MMDMEKDLFMKNEMNDEIAVVNLEDEIVKYETKTIVHEKGLLHRAFSIFIVSNGKMLIQKRNLNKYHSGGLWTNACCSHQRKGEDLKESVHRRLFEELGIDCDLKEKFKFIYRTVFKDGITEYECDHVYLGTYGGSVQVNKNEIDEIKWIDIDELKRELETKPENFTTWFLSAAPGIIRIWEEENE